MSYDAHARRDTPLALKLKALIRERGPLPVKRVMDICLTDREHGYYRRRPAIGASADFVTAPEISQTFGELIGLWAAVVWQQMGAPADVTVVELGPGRGTMLADAMRATARVPGFQDAVRIVLVEPSEALRELQAATLSRYGANVRYLEPGDPVPDGPVIVLANEMLDCIPVGQIVKCAGTDSTRAEWRQRTVTLDDAGHLRFGFGAPVQMRPDGPAPFLDDVPPGSVVEHRDVRDLAAELSRAGSRQPVAAMFIDYGHAESGVGDTLQAVRNHQPEHPLMSPGEADLTAQVDFAAFARTVREEGARAGAPLAVDGPVTQAEFLGRLGIVERASRLMSANPSQATAIETGVARLLAVPGMGDRFKVIGLRSAGLPPLPGF